MKNRKYVRIISWSMFLFFIVMPFLFLACISVTHSWRWPELLPRVLSLRAWNILLSDPQVVQAVYQTTAIGSLVVLFNLLLALPAGKALANYSFYGKNLIETIIMLPILIPSLAVAMGIHITLIRLGLADSWVGVVLVHLLPTLPYSIRIFRAGFERLGVMYEEQARSLGVPAFVIWQTITLPLLLPSIRSTIILTFVISLSQYLLTAVIGGGNVITLAIIFYPFFSSTDRSVLAAFSLLFALLPLLFLAVIEFFIRVIPHAENSRGQS